MDKARRNAGVRVKVKKKMTKEQMQLAITKKKECDSKALLIVERLLESVVDPEWLIENLVHINKCHMEDAIEERAITKLCGYVLCQKPLTVVINQRYHISLKSKKVYDVTKRKNFCSSSCFGASNYLLEQMLTSPLWLRDKEEIPKFQIFSKNNKLNVTHGEELDISIIDHCLKGEMQIAKNVAIVKENSVNNVNPAIETHSEVSNKKKISESLQDFVFETIKNISNNKINSDENIEIPNSTDTLEINNELKVDTENRYSKCTEKNTLKFNDNKDIIKQRISFDKQVVNKESHEPPVIENVNLEKVDNSKNTNKLNSVLNYTETLQSDVSNCSDELKKDKLHKHRKTEKSKLSRKKTQVEDNKALIVINLAARVEKSFQEWITEETVNFLFGDDTAKQKTFENIERQDKYSILCKKLNKLQFQDQQEDFEQEKPILKPLPHFTILKEEGQKLDLKVHAFYKGTTNIETLESKTVDTETSSSDTFLPLTDVQAPVILRRKIFLDRLDQILPELLRTLAGNNEVYARASCSYTSVRCTAVKALIHTFSLSAKNIIFKTVEWTLVGLVIIKMLSLLDPWLSTLLSTKQANMYISMILTSYKLDSHYLNLLVASFNPNINPK